ncbi:hypothetical protein [Proteus columbae]|uniref:hypothetical protein n=1 Tax=Proteus columbae TaxID=1987580 RepID=UPI00288938AF|nr:hypothetical protein [Proteus columbae]
MDKSRQQFEEWINKNHPKCSGYHKDIRFEAWQASRESLGVELPELFIANENCETWCYDEDLVNQALISNGVKIKNE